MEGVEGGGRGSGSWPCHLSSGWGLVHRVSAHLSRDRPQAMTDTSSGSPIGSSISGRNTPEFPTSTHFCRPAHTCTHGRTVILGKEQVVARDLNGHSSSMHPTDTGASGRWREVELDHDSGRRNGKSAQSGNGDRAEPVQWMTSSSGPSPPPALQGSLSSIDRHGCPR